MVKAATEASAGDAARAADALDALLGVRVTAELLADTGVGKEVKRLSKSKRQERPASRRSAARLRGKVARAPLTPSKIGDRTS